MENSGKPNQKIKRVMDLCLCALGLPVAAPLGALLGLCVWLDGGSSPIYTQERIGRDGKKFTLYKFRTMVPGADTLLKKCLEEHPELAREWKENQKIRHDPRITVLGKFLRKTSLDELPQLINIIKGDMSLVGPRPIVEEEAEKYGKHFVEYCETRPGLTGLWQVSGRNNTTYSQRVAFDRYYVRNWRPGLDWYILLKTIPAVIKGNGSY